MTLVIFKIIMVKQFFWWKFSFLFVYNPRNRFLSPGIWQEVVFAFIKTVHVKTIDITLSFILNNCIFLKRKCNRGIKKLFVSVFQTCRLKVLKTRKLFVARRAYKISFSLLRCSISFSDPSIPLVTLPSL